MTVTLTVLFAIINVIPPLQSAPKLFSKKTSQNKITLKKFQNSFYAT